jgi:sulfate-transporting ATPase
VRFGGVVAVDGVSLEVRPGEVVGLIGPNGAGKTTLVDIVTGFTRADAGHVTLEGRRIDRWSPRRRAQAGIARSFQSLELFEDMTVRDNLRTASDRRDPLAYLSDLVWPRNPPLHGTAVAAIREFGLEDDLDRMPSELPYGRRRLVAIARAVAARPSVLLLDEPAAGLDEHETAELAGLVRRLAADWGLAVLLIEHDVSLVMAVCDRIEALDFGRTIASGTPEQIRANAAVVSAYLGEPDGADGQVPITGRASAGGAAVAAPAVDGERPPVAADGQASAPLLSAESLSAGYGRLAAVRDLDLEVCRGEVVVLLGPNGAGKTTTLKTLAGALPPLGGQVSWEGAPTRAPLHRRTRAGLAYVPEERSVFMGLTVAENLRIGEGPPEAAYALFPELEEHRNR